MRGNLSGSLLIFILMTCLGACENDLKNCNAEVNSTLQINFYQKSGDNIADTSLPALSITALGNSDSLYNNAISQSQATLPLDQNADTSTFYIRSDSTAVADTFSLIYKHSLAFVSTGCGFSTDFRIDTLISTHNTLDSISVSVKNVTTKHGENVQFYY